jgi:hypothetical protein
MNHSSILTLLSIIRGLCWRVVYSLTSDPVCLSLRCCLTNRIRSQWMNHSSTQASYNRQQRKDKQTGSEVNEWTTRQYRPRIIDNNVKTNKQDQKSMNEPLVNTGHEACVDEWFIHWLLILFVCPYVVVYYTRLVLTSGSFIDLNEPLVNTGLV